ncbi:ECF transporter S component [Ornithinibacillus sp. 4-3]|uniref:Riboflavin transporter n=1 Tax=Ornithinibacillus sp. 4-3 TaxID=3231488 RepID=A0AB39HI13_9BACI
MRSNKLFKLIILSLLGTISLLLFFLNFPLPFLPGYLKIDFGDIPALIAGLIFSPLASVIVIGIKNALYLAVGGGEPVGVLSNFLAASMFVLPVSILYHKYKTVKSVVSGLVIGTLVMAIGMSILNYLVLLPIYAWFMGMEEMKLESVKRITVLFGILPFNLIKGAAIGLLFVPVFLKMKNWVERKKVEFV